MVSAISAQTCAGLINSTIKVRIETEREMWKGQRKDGKRGGSDMTLVLITLARVNKGKSNKAKMKEKNTVALAMELGIFPGIP